MTNFSRAQLFRFHVSITISVIEPRLLLFLFKLKFLRKINHTATDFWESKERLKNQKRYWLKGI